MRISRTRERSPSAPISARPSYSDPSAKRATTLSARSSKLTNSLHTSKELVSFDDRADSVVARFADGSEYEGRALVGAHGRRPRGAGGFIGGRPPPPAGPRPP